MPRGSIHARRRRVQKAFSTLLKALGQSATGDLALTPARAAALWTERLVPELSADLSGLFAGSPRAKAHTPVILRDLRVHLVCPHHLTVAFGVASVAYFPGRILAGFGALAHLVESVTAGLILQEQATQAIAEALIKYVGATSAAAVINAQHPCHNVAHPRSHAAVAETWAASGDPRESGLLSRLLARHAPQPCPKGKRR
jgi:GTP cyclohydrolase I